MYDVPAKAGIQAFNKELLGPRVRVGDRKEAGEIEMDVFNSPSGLF